MRVEMVSGSAEAETWGARILGGRFDEQNEFAADAIAGGELLAHFGDGAAQEFFVDLGEFAGGDDAETRGRRRIRDRRACRAMRCGAS